MSFKIPHGQTLTIKGKSYTLVSVGVGAGGKVMHVGFLRADGSYVKEVLCRSQRHNRRSPDNLPLFSIGTEVEVTCKHCIAKLTKTLADQS